MGIGRNIGSKTLKGTKNIAKGANNLLDTLTGHGNGESRASNAVTVPLGKEGKEIIAAGGLSHTPDIENINGLAKNIAVGTGKGILGIGGAAKNLVTRHPKTALAAGGGLAAYELAKHSTEKSKENAAERHVQVVNDQYEPQEKLTNLADERNKRALAKGNVHSMDQHRQQRGRVGQVADIADATSRNQGKNLNPLEEKNLIVGTTEDKERSKVTNLAEHRAKKGWFPKDPGISVADTKGLAPEKKATMGGI